MLEFSLALFFYFPLACQTLEGISKMDLDPEFPLVTSREREIIEQYLDLELEFMASANFFEDLHTSEMRNDAFRTISQACENSDHVLFQCLA